MSAELGNVRIRLLGPVGATVGEVEVDIGGPKERAVLALLAANPAATISADRLIDAIWGDHPPQSAKKTLQTYVSRLRKALGTAHPTEVIITGPGGYALSSAVTTDVEEIDALMASAVRARAATDASARSRTLAEALDLFVGEPLSATAPSVALDALAESYDQLRWNLIEELASARLAAGGDQTLSVDLHAWVDENPYRERLWGHLITTLYRAGRQADALATFQRARSHLAEGLGIEPGPELRELEARVLQHDPSLLEPDAPAGATQAHMSETLTFLFTDIEQSTVRWDLEPEPMREALELHDTILTSIIESAGGRIFAWAGDGFGAAFANPATAAKAGLDAQVRLEACDWPTSEPLRIRMGLHTGTAENRGGDFFGAPVNRAARVMDAAHGGQIVCSGATAALLGDDPDLGGQVRFLAECALKGLARPERIHQLGGAENADAFPPPRSTSAPDREVPAVLDSLHGRDAELVELTDILAAQRLVTLTGVGGTGKTRLALELAHRVKEAYPDGVIWLELAAVDADGVVGAAAQAIGVPLAGSGESHRGQVAAALRDERALFVLDNCEHLLGVAAENIEAILRTCPGVSILTTSREPLGVAGERVYVVPSLGLPSPTGGSASEELLRARATSAGAVIADDEATSEAIREICVRVDGVPLALEFAAAQLATYPAPELVRHLEEHFRMLGRPGRSSVPRQQTIDSTIEWSYRLLDEADQRMLARLAVFQGGFALDAVAPVAGFDLDPGTSHLVLDRLRRKSLVTVSSRPGDPRTRFKLLEPVRQFAHSQLRLGGEFDAILERHADHFAASTARPLDGDRFAREHERAEGVVRDAPNQYLALTTLSRRDDPTEAFKLIDAQRGAFSVRWDFAAESAALVAPLLDRPDVQADPVVTGHACNTLAMIDSVMSVETGRSWAFRALELAEQSGDETLRAEAEFHLGTALAVRGDGAGGETHLRRSCELHDRLGNWGTLSYNLCWLAWSLTLQGRFEEAVDPARRGAQLVWDHAATAASSATVAATVLAAAGRADEATAILERADSHEIHDPSYWALLAALITGRAELATRVASDYLSLRHSGLPRDADGVTAIAVLCRRLGETDLAALWSAVAAGRERRFSPFVDSSNQVVGTDLLRLLLGSGAEVDATMDDAVERLGVRFEELARHYESTDDPGPVRDTFAVLDGHRARLARPDAETEASR